jgi:hypothetical protein
MACADDWAVGAPAVLEQKFWIAQQFAISCDPDHDAAQ